MKHILILVGLLLDFGISAADESSLVIIIPHAKSALVNAPTSSVVGRYDTSAVSSIQLLEPFQTKKRIDISTKEQKEAFPKAVRQMFPDEFLIEKVILASDRIRGRSDTTEYQFGLNESIDLKQFWASSQFRQMLAIGYDKKVASCEVTLIGRLKKEILPSQEGYRQKFGNMFSFVVSLQPGPNNFYLRALAADGNMTSFDTVAFFYQTQLQHGDPPSQFQRQPFHVDSLENQCSPCHSLALSESVQESKPAVETECSPCHNNLVNQKSSHVPANTWDCLMCHNPASAPKYQLYADKKYDASLCFECHSDKQEALSSMQTKHAPAESGECLTCHDPHGTQNDALLVDRVINICSSCHEEMVSTPHPVVGHPLGGRPDPLRPGKELTCAACHDPHASDSESLLPVPRMQLCQKCHQK